MILFSLLTLAVSSCRPSDGNIAIKDVIQDTSHYLDQASKSFLLVSEDAQKALQASYLKNYYAPWSMNENDPIIKKTKQEITDEANAFLKQPGWSMDKKQHPVKWVQKLIDNMDMKHYPSIMQTGITTKTTHIRRALPTSTAAYKNPHNAGDGYPFDLLQYSLIPANLPLLIAHQTPDKKWSLIISHVVAGWAKTKDLTNVDQEFIKQWQSHSYITPTQYETPVLTKSKNTLFKARLGMILPLQNETESQFEILAAVKSKGGNATINIATIKKQAASHWPISITAENIATLSNQLINEPYGWGGLFHYRDCSSAMMNIFSPFAIWLPRNSIDQAHAGPFIPLDHLDEKGKQAIIHEQAKPWLTLINMDGHVMLYIGEKDRQQFALQNKWGIHTSSPIDSNGRSIIGKTFISPLTLGKGYMNVPKSDLDRTYGITVLGDPLKPKV